MNCLKIINGRVVLLRRLAERQLRPTVFAFACALLLAALPLQGGQTSGPTDKHDQPCPNPPCCPPGHAGKGGQGGSPGANGGGGATPSSNGGAPAGADPGNWAGSDATPCSSCGGDTSAVGMPIWRVSEPYINLWLEDEPLGYNPGVGQRVSFSLNYKQREGVSGTNAAVFSCGPMWNFSWLSYITLPLAYSPGDYGGNVEMYLAGGGERYYTNEEPEYYTGSVFIPDYTNAYPSAGHVVYPNGAIDYYECQFAPDGSFSRTVPVMYFLTGRADPAGHLTQFVYDTDSTSTVQLIQVIDADGRTTTLNYNNATFPNQITSVTDPFGRTCTLSYNSAGALTNITDVAGNSSSFFYSNYTDHVSDDMTNSTFLWVTNMTTPYGTTAFTYTDKGYPNVQGTNLINRSIMVVDPIGGTNLYLYQDYSPYITNSTYIVPSLPSSVPVIDDYYMNYRNSWHWGPMQFASLSTNNMNSFTYNDFLKGREQHWLHDSATASNLSDTLSMEQEPSPDGFTVGQQTWYAYPGETYPENGTNAQPAVIAYNLPDGKTNYTWIRRDGLSHPTNIVETYSLGFGTPMLTRTNIYLYGTNGIDLIQHIGPLGETVEGYSYDTNHDILAMTNAVGYVAKYTYDSNLRLTSITTPAGLTTTNIYFPTNFYFSTNEFDTNWIQSTIDLQINRTNYFSYSNDLVLTQTNELGLATAYTWDNLQRLTSVTYPDATYVSNIYTNLDLIQRIDRLGYSTKYEYDGLRHLIAITNALGSVTRYNYCTCGALESVQDALSNYTYYTYDIAGRLTNTAYPDGSSMTEKYNLLNQITNTTDGAGVSVTNWFNNQGTLYASSNAFGQVFSMILDIKDRVTNNVDLDGVTTTNSYDLIDRMLVRHYPDGGVESAGYSPVGLIAYTNQLANVTRYSYAAAVREIAETNANTQVTQYAYDPADNLITLTDAKTNIMRWGYDMYGRATNQVDATATTILKYGYDANDRLTNRWSIQKGNTVYGYDSVGNLTSVTYPSNSALGFFYDAKNELTNMTDGIGMTKFTWTQTGLPASETGPWTSNTVTFSYNQSHRTNLSLTQPAASPWTQSYNYDLAWRMTSIGSPAGTFGYRYPAPANRYRVGSITLPNEASITNQYDSVSRLTNTALLNYWGHPLDGYQYALNLLGSRTNIIRSMGFSTNSVAVGYDPITQVTGWTGKEANGTLRQNEQLGYGFDAAHNLQLRTNGALVQTFAVNAVNELTNVARTGPLTVTGATPVPASVTVNGTAAQTNGDFTFARTNVTLTNGSNTFTIVAANLYSLKATNVLGVNLPASVNLQYDANGNLTNDGLMNLAYDDENQLIQVSVSNHWMSKFSYDGKMRRRIRQEFTWQSGGWVSTNTNYYVYDGNLVIQERDAHTNPAVTYTRGLDLGMSLQGAGGIGGLLARTDSNGPAYYHADGSGNITALMDENENIVARAEYDAFGRFVKVSGSLAAANRIWFSSKETDLNSGLVYYLYRYYNPNLQKWQNNDPKNEIGFQLIGNGFPLGWPAVNLYEFAENNPNGFIDSDGRDVLASQFPGAGLGAGAAKAAAAAAAALASSPAAAAALAAAGVGAAAYCGWQAGTWVCNNTPAGDLGKDVGNWICPMKGKGERNWQGKNPNPYKGTQTDPKNPKNYRYRDPQSGKWISKPKPPNYPSNQ